MSFYRLLQRAFSTSTQLTPSTAVKSISSNLFKERNLKRLVDNFKKSSEMYRFRTKTGIYEDTIRRLASAKRFRWIEEILEDQKKYIDSSKEGFAVRIITLYGRSGLFEHAQKVFDEMPERNCKRTVLSLNALLSACINSKKYDKVDGLFKELPKKLSIEPDLVSYNTVIKAFCEMGSLDLAVSVLDEMEKKGLEPDLVSFNTLLNGLYGNGRFSVGETIWSQMRKKNITPDTKEAAELIVEMRSKGIAPDVFTFNYVIKSSINEGNLEGAKEWYSQIRKSDCSPDKVTYETLIPFVCEKGDLDFAYDLCEEIFKRRFLFDEAKLQRVVDELVKASKIVEANKIVELGKTNNYRRYKLKFPSAK
ncbi:hypothetical protein FNV43_RR07715 [Rhamnella rubrinervis]|uniref:Pentatricopeptide repeat-containing protein n=1 Tax=Rhamnella rubrinervis TaxID=2594499 RepID=A0A8K0HH27_9ROSA|nr:hypothetical protein FNV43_RR07715 [Rhamnella rubrinervis]